MTFSISWKRVKDGLEFFYHRFPFFFLSLIFAYTASKKREKIRLLYGSLRVYGSIIFGNKEVGQKCVDNTRGCLPCLFPVPKQETGLPQYPGIWATNWVIHGSSDCQLLWLPVGRSLSIGFEFAPSISIEKVTTTPGFPILSFPFQLFLPNIVWKIKPLQHCWIELLKKGWYRNIRKVWKYKIFVSH